MTSLHSQVLIVGGGFSGIATSIKLLKDWKVTDFHVYDRNDKFGGTWTANTYPGAASDIPAVWYCLASDPKVDWKNAYPSQEELSEYIAGVVDKYGLKAFATFNAEIQRVEWLPEERLWKATISRDGETITHTARALFMGQGCLVSPNHVQIKGMEDFQGPIMHTAEWKPFDYGDKDVVVIGNGCSAAQVISEVAKTAKSVTQFARSPQWIVPRTPGAVGPVLRVLFRWFPFLIPVLRFFVFCMLELNWNMFRGGWLSDMDRSMRTKVSVSIAKQQLPEKYHETAIPKYQLGCKRIIFDCGYWAALRMESVLLTFDKLVEVGKQSVRDFNGKEYPADLIVDATGFNIGRSMGSVDVVGENGMPLSEFWDGKVAAYETVMIPNYPNMFMLFGPNATTGHNSVIFAIENGLKFVESVASDVIQGRSDYVTVKPQAYEQWVQRIQKAIAKTNFATGGCVSWYMSVGEATHNAVSYPWTQLRFWWRARFPHYGDIYVAEKEGVKGGVKEGVKEVSSKALKVE
ncbi:Baeyer-Villiger monooxygenase [Yarrowia sp. B02]|nr:Baeyer-Villiger monooxygenase [Yarrowia sp. B02]